ncbi:hypothetical protein RB195_009060 [Necator americanus]|uniref:Thioredoxin domain-containing protein n=1 Tax=Necator americanus TaxID=51031 RepID=A0ABR1CRQ0_NECAM
MVKSSLPPPPVEPPAPPPPGIPPPPGEPPSNRLHHHRRKDTTGPCPPDTCDPCPPCPDLCNNFQMDDCVYILTYNNFDDFATMCPTFVANFYADWCLPSMYMTPVYQRVAKRVSIPMAKIDAERNGAITNRYHLQKYPTLMLWKDRKGPYQYIGKPSEEEKTGAVFFFFEADNKSNSFCRSPTPKGEESLMTSALPSRALILVQLSKHQFSDSQISPRHKEHVGTRGESDGGP